MRNRRILYVITKSNWGGVQAYVHTLAKRAQDEGAEVAVALGGTGAAGASMGVLAKRLTAAGIQIFPISAFMRDISIRAEFASLFQLHSVMRSFRPDVVHLNSSKAGGIGALAARLASVPCILFTAHGWGHREPRSLLARLLIWLSSWATIALCHKIIAVSERDVATAPVFFAKKKVHLVRNGMPDMELLPRSTARTYISSLAPHLNSDSPWLLMVAELHRNKGIDVALKALARIADKGVQLVVMGEGEERAALTRLATELGLSDRVALVGFVSDPRQYLNAADIFCLSSRKEGLPLALLEAGLASLPVVASKTGGVPEVITDGTGLLVEPENEKELADAISALLEDTGARARYGQNLRARVLSEFSEERMVSETFRLY